jgi:hypothetical protein
MELRALPSLSLTHKLFIKSLIKNFFYRSALAEKGQCPFEFQALIFSFHQGSILKFFLVSKNGSAP